MMPLCGVTKQQNSLKCCNILAETSVKTHFHKRKQGTRLTKGGTRFFFQRDTREVSELHYLHSPSVVSISMPRLVSVRPKNEGITTLRSASSCAHDSSFSA